jgi:hypothetical protein
MGFLIFINGGQKISSFEMGDRVGSIGYPRKAEI